MMKTQLRSRLFGCVSLLLCLGVVFPALAQEEETEAETAAEGRFLKIYAHAEAWIAQPNGLNYYPVTYYDPSDPLFTALGTFASGTNLAMRYRAGVQFRGDIGSIVLTYYSHMDERELSGFSPGDFIYGEVLAHPLFAGYAEDGLADGFSAASQTGLRDMRVDFYREAFRTKRVSGKWFVGYRRVIHNRHESAGYYALLPDFPPYIPSPGSPFPYTPLADEAETKSNFNGRGLEAGMEFRIPLWSDRVWIESEFVLAVLRGKTDTFYKSTTHFYAVDGVPISPLDFGDSFPLDLTQETLPVGLRGYGLPSSAQVLDISLGLRYRVWRGIEVFGGLRNIDYSDVGIDLIPRASGSSVGINVQDVTQTSHSANYEGFYFGVSFLF